MKRADADVVVVGAGLAGLCAAAVLARAGRPVTVLEGAATPGGRAQTRVAQGFAVNIGPHALYAKGRGRAILRDLAIPVAGAVPRVDGFALRAGTLHRLPAGPAGLLLSGLLSWREKLDMARVMAALPRLDTAKLDGVPLSAWLASISTRPRVRDLLAAYVRVSTYADDTQAHSAGAALAQLQRALGGVLYLDGGWQTLVEGLRQTAVTAGARILNGRRVARVEIAGARVTGVLLQDGTHLSADVAVLTGGPHDAASLVDGPAGQALSAVADAARPITAACLDVALHALPRPDRLFALGVDTPVYFSVHSATAALAPKGGALVHVARYGGASDTHAAAVRTQLEGVMDTLQPGWREHVVLSRFTPHLTVSHALPTAPQLGLRGRPAVDVAGLSGLFVAGDWVGGLGLLADASLASGHAAAQAILRDARCVTASAELLATA